MISTGNLIRTQVSVRRSAYEVYNAKRKLRVFRVCPSVHTHTVCAESEELLPRIFTKSHTNQSVCKAKCVRSVQRQEKITGISCLSVCIHTVRAEYEELLPKIFMKSNLQKQQQTEVDTVHTKRAYGGGGYISTHRPHETRKIFLPRGFEPWNVRSVA